MAFLDAAAEPVERAKGHVLLVGGAARQPTQVGAGQPDEAREIPPPQAFGGVIVAGAEAVDQSGDGVVGVSHRTPPARKKQAVGCPAIVPRLVPTGDICECRRNPSAIGILLVGSV